MKSFDSPPFNSPRRMRQTFVSPPFNSGSLVRVPVMLTVFI